MVSWQPRSWNFRLLISSETGARRGRGHDLKSREGGAPPHAAKASSGRKPIRVHTHKYIPMHASAYKEMRKRIGSQSDLAERLGIAQKQISNRETGQTPISQRDEWAVRWLVEHGEMENELDRANYKNIRKRIGTQGKAANCFGIAQKQISDREKGRTPISRTDQYALCWLEHSTESNRPTKKKARRRPRRQARNHNSDTRLILKRAILKKLKKYPSVYLTDRFFEIGLGPKSLQRKPMKVIEYREAICTSGVMVTVQSKPRARKYDVDSDWLCEKVDGSFYPLAG